MSPAQYDGADCAVVDATETRNCSTNGCPGNAFCSIQVEAIYLLNFLVNCTWGTWSTWEDCSVTCGGGTQGRSRSIDVPAQNNGTACTGSTTDSQNCSTNGCPGRVLRFSPAKLILFLSQYICLNVDSKLYLGYMVCLGVLFSKW